MTTPTGRAETPAQALLTVWVSLEGPNGVGKSFLAGELLARLGPDARLVAELTDIHGPTLPAEVIAALSAGESFLRTGHPLTETFALLALKVREHELIAGLAERPAVVVEDRGVDTVALYQAAIILGRHASDDQVWQLAQQVYAAAGLWRPPPRLTLLILDELDSCARRYSRREGRGWTSDERALVARAARLYQRQAEHEPHRFRIVGRAGRPTGEVLRECQRHIRDTLRKRTP